MQLHIACIKKSVSLKCLGLVHFHADPGPCWLAACIFSTNLVIIPWENGYKVGILYEHFDHAVLFSILIRHVTHCPLDPFPSRIYLWDQL